MNHSRLLLLTTLLGSPLTVHSQPTDTPIMVPMAQLRSNSDVMSLQLRRQGNALSLADTIPDTTFPGKRTAYYINGQYLGPTREGFHPLPGTRMGIGKYLLDPAEVPTHWWQIKPDRKAQALIAIPDPNAALRKKQNPQRQYLPPWFEDKAEFRATKFAPKFTLIESKVNGGCSSAAT